MQDNIKTIIDTIINSFLKIAIVASIGAKEVLANTVILLNLTALIRTLLLNFVLINL